MNRAKMKIFLADERGLNETDWYRSRSTFNFVNFFNEHKQPFCDLYVLNDEVLDAGRSMSICIEEYSFVMLLPVIGAIAFKYSSGHDNLISAGQLQILAVDKNEKIEITNPFGQGLVNFLQIGIRADKSTTVKGSELSTYDINQRLNSLLKISSVNLNESSLPFSISIGKFDGRGEATCQVKNNEAGTFVFVLEGAFEVQGTLLHARDGLALWETWEVEMEALSNDAIVLFIGLPLK